VSCVYFGGRHHFAPRLPVLANSDCIYEPQARNTSSISIKHLDVKMSGINPSQMPDPPGPDVVIMDEAYASYRQNVEEINGLYAQLYEATNKLLEKEDIPIEAWEKLNEGHCSYDTVQSHTEMLYRQLPGLRESAAKLDAAIEEIPAHMMKIVHYHARPPQRLVAKAFALILKYHSSLEPVRKLNASVRAALFNVELEKERERYDILQHKYDELETEKADEVERLSRLQQDASNDALTISTLRKEIRGYIKAQQELDGKLAAANNATQEKQRSLDLAESLAKSARQELSDSKAEQRKIKHLLHVAEAKITAKNATIQALTAADSVSRESLESERRSHALTTVKLRRTERLHGHDNIKRLNAAVETKTDELLSARTDLHKANSLATASSRDLDVKKDELQTAYKKLAEVEAELQTVNSEVTRLNDVVTRTNRQPQTANASLSAANADLQKANSEVTTLKVTAEKNAGDLQQSQKQIANAEAELKERQTRVTELEAKLEERTGQLSISQQTLRTAQSNLDAERKVCIAKDLELGQVKDQLITANRKLDSSRATVSARDITIQGKQETLDAAEKKVAELAGVSQQLDVKTAKLESLSGKLAKAQGLLQTTQSELDEKKLSLLTAQTKLGEALKAGEAKDLLIARTKDEGKETLRAEIERMSATSLLR
jgi:chromosome segregation ATPase